MPPISVYTSFATRPSDLKTKINPLCKYFFICEGANTESFYFKHLIDNKKELGFESTVSMNEYSVWASPHKTVKKVHPKC